MTKEYASEMVRAIKNGLHETGKDFPYRDEVIPVAKDALDMASRALDGISALSKDLKAIDRSSMSKETLIGFNTALALFNKHLGRLEQ